MIKQENFKILIVDSNQNFVDILNTYLIKFKLIVLLAYSGSEAKSIIEIEKPKLVISEVDLPDISGIEFLHWSNKNHPSIKTILMTSDIHIIDQKESIELGAFDFLVKPFPTEELDRVLKRLFPNLLSENEKNKINEQKYHKDDISNYMETSFQEFLTGNHAPVSVYLKLSSKKLIKIIHKGDPITDDIIEKYKARGIKYVYLLKKEYQQYLDLCLKVADVVKDKKNITIKRKTKYLIHVSDTLQEKMFKNSFNKKDFEAAQSFVETSLDISGKSKSFLDLVNSLKKSDNRLYAHSLSVSIYATMLAKELRWTTEKTRQCLAVGGFLHDIGKKKLSKDIQCADYFKLEENDKTNFENHVIFGIEVLSGVEDISKEILQIIMQHHELIDGSGYPFGLTNVNIYPLAKLVSLIDKFSLLIMPLLEDSRSVSPAKAYEIICSDYAKKFDRKMIEALGCMIS